MKKADLSAVKVIWATAALLCSIGFGTAAPAGQVINPAVSCQAWTLTKMDLAAIHPNEAGEIPVLEYHNITTSSKMTAYEYSAADFRKDMEWLYAHNYRPISLSDYVRGWIDVPAGKSPVVITFDDALCGQFSCEADGTIDPNCAVGILDSMHKEHPDWATKATFFVLTNIHSGLPAPFTAPGRLGAPPQAPFAHMKMNYLVQHGYEIGNHTLHHSMKMRTMPATVVENEFVGGQNGIRAYLPNYDVQTLALPYGIYPADLTLVKCGETLLGRYNNICAMAAGCKPAPSPITTQFDPYVIPRIIPRNKALPPGGRYTIRYWLNHLQLFPAEKFVSDGDPSTYTLPFNEIRSINFEKIKTEHYKIRLYRGSKVVQYSEPSST